MALGWEAPRLNSPWQRLRDSERSLRTAKGNMESSQSFLNKWFFNNLFLTGQLLVGLKIDALANYQCVCAGCSAASEQRGRTGHLLLSLTCRTQRSANASLVG